MIFIRVATNGLFQFSFDQIDDIESRLDQMDDIRSLRTVKIIFILDSTKFMICCLIWTKYIINVLIESY